MLFYDKSCLLSIRLLRFVEIIYSHLNKCTFIHLKNFFLFLFTNFPAPEFQFINDWYLANVIYDQHFLKNLSQTFHFIVYLFIGHNAAILCIFYTNLGGHIISLLFFSFV